MGLKEKTLKRLMKKKIIEVFTGEIKMYANAYHLNIPEEKILDYIRMYLERKYISGKEGIEEIKVIEVFNDRVKFYSAIIYPSLSETVIKEVLREYLTK